MITFNYTLIQKDMTKKTHFARSDTVSVHRIIGHNHEHYMNTCIEYFFDHFSVMAIKKFSAKKEEIYPNYKTLV